MSEARPATTKTAPGVPDDEEGRKWVDYREVEQGKALNPQGGLDYVVCVFVGTVDGKEKRKLIPRCVARAVKKVYDKNLSPFFESLLEASQDRRCDGYSVNMALNVLDYRGLRYKLEFQVGARKRSDPYKPGIRLLPQPPQDGERLVLGMPFGERVTVVGEFKVHHRFVLQALHNIEKTQSLRMSFATKKDGKVVCEVVEFGTEVMTAKYKVQDKRTKAERVVCRVGDSWWFEDEHEHDKDDKEELVLVFVDVAGKQFRAVGYDKAIDRFKVVEVLENNQQPLELYLRHSWFAWMYEAGEQAKPPSYTGTEFEVSCNERGIASALENAMVLCRQTAEFEHDGVKYTAYLVGKMVQQQTAAPAHRRRVFRYGTEFRDDYASVVPVLNEAPSYWCAKRVGERRLVKVEEGEEWDMVQSFVESSVRKHNYVAGFRGLTGKWLEEAGHKNVFGAFHIAEVYRNENPQHFLQMRCYANKVDTRQCVQLREYLKSQPLSTGVVTGLANEVWMFHGVDRNFANTYLHGRPFSVRAFSNDNTFGRGTYVTEDVVKAPTYSPCRCGVARGANNTGQVCTCAEPNTTHPRVVFLSRVVLGNALVLRSRAQYLMRSLPGSDDEPTFGIRKDAVALWFDTPDTADETQRIVDQRLSIKHLDVEPRCLSDETAKLPLDIKNTLHLFVVKHASTESPGFKKLLEEAKGKQAGKDFLFAVIVDQEADDCAVELAMAIHTKLGNAGAAERLYRPAEVEPSTRLETLVAEKDKRVEEPGRGKYVWCDDLQDTSPVQARAMFLESTQHRDPAVSAKHKVAAFTQFNEQQLKHRECVVYDEKALYPEYILLLYTYKNEEEMLKNMRKEVPFNGTGRSAFSCFVDHEETVAGLEHPTKPIVLPRSMFVVGDGAAPIAASAAAAAPEAAAAAAATTTEAAAAAATTTPKGTPPPATGPTTPTTETEEGAEQ